MIGNDIKAKIIADSQTVSALLEIIKERTQDCQCPILADGPHAECNCWYCRACMLISKTEKSCPYDTNGDGDCGQKLCPYCGDR